MGRKKMVYAKRTFMPAQMEKEGFIVLRQGKDLFPIQYVFVTTERWGVRHIKKKRWGRKNGTVSRGKFYLNSIDAIRGREKPPGGCEGIQNNKAFFLLRRTHRGNAN